MGKEVFNEGGLASHLKKQHDMRNLATARDTTPPDIKDYREIDPDGDQEAQVQSLILNLIGNRNKR